MTWRLQVGSGLHATRFCSRLVRLRKGWLDHTSLGANRMPAVNVKHPFGKVTVVIRQVQLLHGNMFHVAFLSACRCTCMLWVQSANSLTIKGDSTQNLDGNACCAMKTVYSQPVLPRQRFPQFELVSLMRYPHLTLAGARLHPGRDAAGPQSVL